jgi:hypothetical protein
MRCAWDSYMLEISLTWGDVLVHSAIGLGVALFLAILYKYVFPSISDYWARRSLSTRRKRIHHLTVALDEYEADFVDTRLFIGRIIFKTVWTIITLGFSLCLIIMSTLYHVSGNLRCEFYHNCINLWLLDFNSLEVRTSVFFWGLATLFQFVFFVTVATLRLEISPAKYRASLRERLARLGDRSDEPPRTGD